VGVREFGFVIFSFLVVLSSGPGSVRANDASPSFELSAECQINSDQANTFSGAVSQTMNALVDNRFDKGQKKMIQTAADTWNKAGLKLFGWNFFQVQFVDIPPAIAGSKSFDCGLDFGGKDFFYLIRVESDSQWRALHLDGDRSDDVYAPGVTQSCFHPITHALFEEAVLINDYAAGYQQFQSIVLHELGHALGLLHSCDGTDPKISQPGYVSCEKIASSHPYHLAIMYPQLRKADSMDSMPEIKDSLGDNDLVRLQCLYGKK
jgi:hypothetical protein